MSVGPYFLFPAVQAELIAAARAQRVEIGRARSQRELRRSLKPVHHWQFDDQHLDGRARQEIAMRNGTLRTLPSCFGVLK